MSIGININCYSNELSIDRQIELMKENGFETTFCMADDKNIRSIIEQLQASGIKFETLHAPFSHINDMWKEDDCEMLKELCDSIRLCAEYSIPVLVVHQSAGRPAPLINDYGNTRYDALMEEARKYGVKIAFENSRCVGNVAAALERYPDAYFCWDVGHEHCFTPGMMFLPYFKDRVGALHLQDNMCQLDRDIHVIPYDGLIDMESVAKRLAQSSYKNSIMLELGRHHSDMYTDLSPEEYYKRAAAAARRFERAVDSYR